VNVYRRSAGRALSGRVRGRPPRLPFSRRRRGDAVLIVGIAADVVSPIGPHENGARGRPSPYRRGHEDPSRSDAPPVTKNGDPEMSGA
jgi:hypothetical protein